MSRKAKIALRDPSMREMKLKMELCEALRRSWWRRGWNQTQAAFYSGACRNSMSYVDRRRVDRLSIAQLFRYLACAEPNFEILISF